MLFPESPRWQAAHGKLDESLKTLARLHAHGDTQDPWVIAEHQQIQDAILFEQEHEAKGYLELFVHAPSFRRLFLVAAIQASVQMTGVSAIQYFSVDLYAQIGINANDTLKYQAISSVLALVAQFCCICFVDRLGRRWTLIGGNLVNCVFFIIATALLFAYPPSSNNTGAHWGEFDVVKFMSDKVADAHIRFHRLHLALQRVFQRYLRTTFLGHSIRGIRYSHALKGCLSRCHGFLRLQYLDWSSHSYRHSEHWLSLLHCLHRLQLHQRDFLLGVPS